METVRTGFRSLRQASRPNLLLVSELSRLGCSLGEVVALLDAIAKASVAFVAVSQIIREEAGATEGIVGRFAPRWQGGRDPSLPQAGSVEEFHRQDHRRHPPDALQLHRHPRAEGRCLESLHERCRYPITDEFIDAYLRVNADSCRDQTGGPRQIVDRLYTFQVRAEELARKSHQRN